MLFRWFFRLIDGHYKSPRTQKAEIIECHCFCDETERIYTGTIRNEKIMFVVLLSLSSFYPYLLLSNRHPINHNLADDILTQTWFIVMLGSIIAIIIFSFVAMVLIKRIQFIKQTSLTNIHGRYLLYSRSIYVFLNCLFVRLLCVYILCVMRFSSIALHERRNSFE